MKMKRLIVGVLSLALPILVFAPATRATVLAQAAPEKLSGDLVVYADPFHTWISPDGQWVVFTVTVETPVYHTDV